MKRFAICLLWLLTGWINKTNGQAMSERANTFIHLLNDAQRNKAVYPFDTSERYRFHYVPQNDRKGIPVNELDARQQAALITLLQSSLSKSAVQKVQAIMQLELVLKELENRSATDHYRDTGKYFITIFGIPAANTIWGWRFEGHHIAFHFSAQDNRLVAGTPNFLGANPAIVLSGPQKGKAVLQAETDKGLALLNALSPGELKKH